MTKQRILILLVMLTTIQVAAQSNAIDSISRLVAKEKVDSIKADDLLALSKAYISLDPDKAIHYADSARELSERINYRKGIAYGFKNAGNANAVSGKPAEAIYNWEKALAVFTALGDKVGEANILSNEGAVYFNQSDNAKALEFYLKALLIAEQSADTFRMATVLQNIGAIYANNNTTLNKALEYYMRAYPLCVATGDKAALGNVQVNIGEIWLARGNDSLALSYFEQSLEAFRSAGSPYLPYPMNDIGKVYELRRDFANAISYHQQAFEMGSKLNSTQYMTQSLTGLADTWLAQGDYQKAIETYKKALVYAKQMDAVNYDVKNATAGLALSYARSGDFVSAYRYQTELVSLKDSLYNIDVDKKLSNQMVNFEIQKKQTQIDLLTKDKALQDLEINRQKFARNALMAGLILVFIIIFILYRDYRTKLHTNKLLDSQKAQIERLLLNILPAEVANELQTSGEAKPRYYEDVSVLFTDFKNFSILAESLTPQEVVSELNTYFNAFDEIVGKYRLEKIKTIGDSYMCAGGIPTEDDGHLMRMVQAAQEIREFIRDRNWKRIEKGMQPWELRIGINVGPLVAGVVGSRKYAYDIWGSTVNIASRMESSGEPGKINISAAVYERIKDYYNCAYRGKVFAKNIGDIDMYFVDSLKDPVETWIQTVSGSTKVAATTSNGKPSA